MIYEVKQVMYIVLVDDSGCIIGEILFLEGVIGYDKKVLFLCGGFINVFMCLIIEVYLDSLLVIDEICNLVQVVVIGGVLWYLLFDVNV